MIVAPLGAHLGVFSVLQRLRSVILTSLPLSAVSPLCRGRNGRLSSRGRCHSPVQRAKKQRSTCISYSCCANVHRLCVFFVFVSPSSLYCAWRFLCLFTIDVILRFSGVTSFLCFVWGRFVLFRFCLCLYALCSARTCIVWAFSLFGFDIDLILRFSGVTLFLWGDVSLKSINQPINLTGFVLFQNLAPLLVGELQGRKMKGERKYTSMK